MMVGAFVGGGFGAILGSAIRVEQWDPVYRARPGVHFGMTPEPGIRFTARF
jgi:hypothetical protein